MTLGKTMSFAAALTLAVALSGAASAAQFKNRTNSPPPVGPGKLTGKQHTVKDLYCGPGHVPCDNVFWAYCKLIGGNALHAPTLGWSDLLPPDRVVTRSRSIF